MRCLTPVLIISSLLLINSEFICKREGKFANFNDKSCKSFHNCKKLSNGTLYSTEEICEESYFNPKSGLCGKCHAINRDDCNPYYECLTCDSGSLINQIVKCSPGSYFNSKLNRCLPDFKCDRELNVYFIKQNVTVQNGGNGLTGMYGKDFDYNGKINFDKKDEANNNQDKVTTNADLNNKQNNIENGNDTPDKNISTNKGKILTNEHVNKFKANLMTFYKEKLTQRPDGFVCNSSGVFPNTSDVTCRQYFVCSSLSGALKMNQYLCKEGSSFDPILKSCTSFYICPYSTDFDGEAERDYIINFPGRTIGNNENEKTLHEMNENFESQMDESFENQKNESFENKMNGNQINLTQEDFEIFESITPEPLKLGESINQDETFKECTLNPPLFNTPQSNEHKHLEYKDEKLLQYTDDNLEKKDNTLLESVDNNLSESKDDKLLIQITYDKSIFQNLQHEEDPLNNTNTTGSKPDQFSIDDEPELNSVLTAIKPSKESISGLALILFENACKASGRYPDLSDESCQRYYTCAKYSNGSFSQSFYICPLDLKFDPDHQTCSTKYVCSYKTQTTHSQYDETESDETTELDESKTSAIPEINTTVTQGKISGTTQGEISEPTKTTKETSATSSSDFTTEAKISEITLSTFNTVSTDNPNIYVTTKQTTPKLSTIIPDLTTSQKCFNYGPNQNQLDCKAPGRIPNVLDTSCSSYFLCITLKSGSYTKANYKCPLGSIFDPSISMCSVVARCVIC